jgi:hypothetical protein
MLEGLAIELERAKEVLLSPDIEPKSAFRGFPKDGRSMDIGRPLAAIGIYAGLKFLNQAEGIAVNDIAFAVLSTCRYKRGIRKEDRSC